MNLEMALQITCLLIVMSVAVIGLYCTLMSDDESDK